MELRLKRVRQTEAMKMEASWGELVGKLELRAEKTWHVQRVARRNMEWPVQTVEGEPGRIKGLQTA